MGHDQPSFMFSMLVSFFMPFFLLAGMLFLYKSLKLGDDSARKETNSILREILEELKKQKSG
jgi:hypothetical protein